jgi:transcription elongation factor
LIQRGFKIPTQKKVIRLIKFGIAWVALTLAIQKSNAMVNNKAGMAQTSGHEFFHAIQEILAGRISNETGSNVPNWFWEGPAMFIGQETSGILGYADYVTVSRPSMLSRYQNSNPVNRTSTLSEIKANNQVTDPYAIGFAATEFLVSQVGVEKMLNVYASLGKGMNFSDAFKQGTAIELTDFYSMFEEVRSTLGFAKI